MLWLWLWYFILHVVFKDKSKDKDSIVHGPLQVLFSTKIHTKTKILTHSKHIFLYFGKFSCNSYAFSCHKASNLHQISVVYMWMICLCHCFISLGYLCYFEPLRFFHFQCYTWLGSLCACTCCTPVWLLSISVLYLAGFTLCLYLLYTCMTVVIKHTSATTVNISILSADFYTLLFGLFLFHYKVDGCWLIKLDYQKWYCKLGNFRKEIKCVLLFTGIERVTATTHQDQGTWVTLRF